MNEFDKNLLGHCPLIFIDDEKRKEWENLDPDIKKNVFSILYQANKELAQKETMEMMINVINDLNERLMKLEEKQ